MWTMALAGLVVVFGALIQGVVGFGLALVAAPLLAFVSPTYVPVPLLLITAAHAMLTLHREHTDTDWTGVGWALIGRLPGIVIGVALVAMLTPRAFTAVVGLIVLCCAGLSMFRWRPRPTPRSLLMAGVVSGAGGTAASIGGPPIALLYQRSGGPRVRATLAAYFTVGSVLSIVGLGIGGQVSGDTLIAGVLLLPFMFAGFLLSGPARRWLDRGWTRPAVLGLAMAGALALLVRSALG